MDRFADLHIHTNFSDSTYAPKDVVLEADRIGLACVAITDHDTIDGIEPARDAAQDMLLEVIPGVELSCEQQGRDIHILGYFFDIHDATFNEQLAKFRNTRVERVKKIIQKLRDQGVDNITFDEVSDLASSDALGRPHLAQLLIDKGWVADIRQAFNKYLGENCPAYVPKFKQSPYEAIHLIRQAKGIAVLAHPMITNVDELIPSFVDAGLDGLEIYYPNASKAVVQFYEGIAQKYHLVTTGGSDAHGEDRSHARIGDIMVPYQCVEDMKKRLQ